MPLFLLPIDPTSLVDRRSATATINTTASLPLSCRLTQIHTNGPFSPFSLTLGHTQSRDYHYRSHLHLVPPPYDGFQTHHLCQSPQPFVPSPSLYFHKFTAVKAAYQIRCQPPNLHPSLSFSFSFLRSFPFFYSSLSFFDFYLSSSISLLHTKR